MAKYLWTVTICLALGLSLGACGADDDGDDDAGSGGASGASGVGGKGGMGGAGSGGSMAASGAVPCGSTTCQSALGMFASMAMGLLPAPCCLDSTMGKCGQSMNGGACMAIPPPPAPDPRCPALMLGPSSMAGCCIMDMCGVDASLLGRGCIELGQAKAQSPFPLPFPAPRRCDAPPMTTDAGMMSGDDAGVE